MDSNEYLKASERTVSIPTEDDLKDIESHFLESVEIAQAGAKADFLKRMVFYKEKGKKEAPGRYNETMSKLADAYEQIYDRRIVLTMDNMNIFHGILGIASEVGELEEALIKTALSGVPIDKVNLMEECGDILWYVALILRAIGYTFDEAMEKNILKLMNRPKQATYAERDTDAERKILEG